MLLACCAVCAPAFAEGNDVVVLRDGTRLRGTVVEESASTLVIKLADGRVQTFAKAAVSSVAYEPLPSATSGQSQAPAAPSPQASTSVSTAPQAEAVSETTSSAPEKYEGPRFGIGSELGFASVPSGTEENVQGPTVYAIGSLSASNEFWRVGLGAGYAGRDGATSGWAAFLDALLRWQLGAGWTLGFGTRVFAYAKSDVLPALQIYGDVAKFFGESRSFAIALRGGPVRMGTEDDEVGGAGGAYVGYAF
jgi:hypothetical protein